MGCAEPWKVPPGAMSSVVVAPADQVCRKPPGMTFAEAAAMPLAGITAAQALHEDDVSREARGFSLSRRILIIGAAGGVGHIATQLAASKPNKPTVIAVCSSRSRTFVLGLGATATVPYDIDSGMSYIEM